MKERRQRDHAYARATYNMPNESTSIEIATISNPKPSNKEKKERKAEKNMLYMALTLCTTSIISRILLMVCYIYYFIFYSFATNLLIHVVNYSIQTIVPSISIFVFYFFNKMFREEFNMTFKDKENPPTADRQQKRTHQRSSIGE